LHWIVGLAVALSMGLALPAHAGDVEDAEKAARTWLALVDAGAYDDSWTQSAALFKGAVPKADWASKVGAARGPLGAVRSRARSSATPASSLPGAPDGAYVVIQFAASFEHKAKAVETITPMKDPDGTWRVAGYFIK
jgi:hypothetical protein